MKWDKRLGAVTAAVIVCMALAVAALVWWTTSGIKTSAERIAGHADVGFAELTERTADSENIGHTMIARRGKYEDQSKYADFDEAWLKEMKLIGDGYLEDEIQYTHTVKFLLRTYDTENVYEKNDTREVYGRYTDEAIMFKDGDKYYVGYRSGDVEYRFVVECAPLTEWIDGM